MDYTIFRKGLIPLLEKMHGSTQHVGKVPSRAGKELMKKNELMQLRNELNKAVEREDYERAAELRDRIYELSGDTNED
jgi:protein arginine kinase activator